MGIVISFCITVYNQKELVERCLNSILPYQGKDIEIVISDDGSSEDIRSLVLNHKDSRIRYFKNEINLGHDRNIISALSKARGTYAFLLRTRDMIIPDSIPLLVRAAQVGNASYISGAAVNEAGVVKIHYTKDVFTQGKEALEAHFRLFIHPSGSMFRLKDLDFLQLQDFLDVNGVPKNGFIVHNMIRLKLAIMGDFCLIKDPVWVYTDTESAVDRAVNRSANNISVYDPSLVEARYCYELKWADSILDKNEYTDVYYMLTALYLDQATWGFRLLNSDKKSQYHYDYKRIDFSVSKERKKFKTICDSMDNEKPEEDSRTYERKMNKIFLRNRTGGAFKYFFRKITYGTPLYHAIGGLYKKYVKRL